MPAVSQTPYQALGGAEVCLEEPVLRLGSPGRAGDKRYRGWRKEVGVVWAFGSSQSDGGAADRRQVVLQMPSPEEECWG